MPWAVRQGPLQLEQCACNSRDFFGVSDGSHRNLRPAGGFPNGIGRHARGAREDPSGRSARGECCKPRAHRVPGRASLGAETVGDGHLRKYPPSQVGGDKRCNGGGGRADVESRALAMCPPGLRRDQSRSERHHLAIPVPTAQAIRPTRPKRFTAAITVGEGSSRKGLAQPARRSLRCSEDARAPSPGPASSASGLRRWAHDSGASEDGSIGSTSRSSSADLATHPLPGSSHPIVRLACYRPQ